MNNDEAMWNNISICYGNWQLLFRYIVLHIRSIYGVKAFISDFILFSLYDWFQLITKVSMTFHSMLIAISNISKRRDIHLRIRLNRILLGKSFVLKHSIQNNSEHLFSKYKANEGPEFCQSKRRVFNSCIHLPRKYMAYVWKINEPYTKANKNFF